MKKLVSLICIGFAATTLNGCSGSLAANKVAQSAVQNIGCKVSQSEMWDSLQRIVEENDSFPSAEKLRSELLIVGAAKGFTDARFARFTEAFVSNYSVTIEGIQSSFAPQDLAGWRKALAEMEVGIRVTPIHAELQGKIARSLTQLAAADQSLDVACPSEPERDPAGEIDPVEPIPPSKTFATVWEQLAASEAPEVVGLTKTLATAYQSCDVLNLPPMNSRTPNVSGIKDLGADTRPGGGHIRKIDNLDNVISTDYYIKGQRPAATTCFDIRKDPPIYNFGGKPYTTTSKPQLLDMFTHTHSGGPTLGIDCSGYVFTALAIMGLKMDPDPAKPLKASLVSGIPSGAFKEPQSNGLRCLNKIGFSRSTSILAGDIVAINGHVFFVESIGADPFGLRNAATIGDCTSSKLKSQNFDFVIAQSSPVKNGIGIDLMVAKDYLGSSGTIHDGLVAYAVAACRAQFGASPNLNSPALSIVRHSRSAECKTKPLELTNSECVSRCQPL